MVRSLLNRQRSMILGSIIPLLFAYSYIVNSTTGTVLAAAPICSSWSAVSTGQTGLSDLYGITAISSSDLWAVGDFGSPQQVLVEHATGSGFSAVSTPSTGTIASNLVAISAPSASDIQAVGWKSQDAYGTQRTLTEHYNGSAWSIVSSPNVGTTDNELLSVVALASNNVWAVGDYRTPVPSATLQLLIEHYDGSTWSVLTSPTVGSSSTLRGIAAVSASNIKAVGSYSDASQGQHNLVLTYNGSTWTIDTLPPASQVRLVAITNIPNSTQYTAIGDASTGQSQIPSYDGTQWTNAQNLNQGSQPNGLFSVAALSASDIWAVGYYYDSVMHPLTLHYDGTGWSVKAPFTVGRDFASFEGMTHVGTTKYAVGFDDPTGSGTAVAMAARMNC